MKGSDEGCNYPHRQYDITLSISPPVSSGRTRQQLGFLQISDTSNNGGSCNSSDVNDQRDVSNSRHDSKSRDESNSRVTARKGSPAKDKQQKETIKGKDKKLLYRTPGTPTAAKAWQQWD
jgi:hypothetical protein